MRALLSDDEQRRADRFRQPGDVERFVTGRGALRRVLGEWTGQDPRSLVFIEGGGRKPALRDHPTLQFNLSHSGCVVLIGLGVTPLGVDVEMMRDLDWDGLAQINFHPAERMELSQRGRDAARDTFFQLWANKEAFLKATGIGLTDRLTEIAIPLGGGAVQAPAGFAPGDWFAHPLPAPDGYKAAVVTQAATVDLEYRTELTGL